MTDSTPDTKVKLDTLVRDALSTSHMTGEPLPWYLQKPHGVTVLLFVCLADALGVAVVLTAWSAFVVPLGATMITTTTALCVLWVAEVVLASFPGSRATLGLLDATPDKDTPHETARVAFVQNMRMVMTPVYRLVGWGLVALINCLV